MKKIYALFSFLLLFGIARAQFPAPYCAEAYASGVEPITRVSFGAISHTSAAAIAGTAHEDYTSFSTNVTAGGSYAISVEGNTDGNYTDYIRVFIDWNQNGNFTDVGESFDIGTILNSTGTDGKAATANITIPLGATVGTTRMRVSKKFNAYQTPCNTGGYGESEDYSLVIIAAAGCTGSPIAGTATGPSQACAGNSFTLNLTGSTVASGIHYQWQTTPIGGTTWVNIPNDTTKLVVVLQGATGADYRCMVTCTASNLTDSSTRISVALQTVNCPPVNDKPCDAITLVLDGASNCQNTAKATGAGDPTVFGCSTPNNTTWYKYTPTVSGDVLFTLTTPATGDPLNGWLGVYTVGGTCPGTLTFTDETTTVLGGCKSYGATAGSTTSFIATLTAGTEYYFMVDGVSGDTGSYCIAMKTPPNPPASCATNTLPANAAIDVSTTAVTLKWNTVAAATDYDLYFGTANPPTTLFGNYTADSAVVTGLTYTTTYYWYVVPKNTSGSATGCDANVTSFTTINPPPPPPNDEPCDAVTLVLDGPSDCRNTAFATTSANDPTSFSCSTPNNTVWYKYTPTTSGSVLFSFTPPATGTALNGWLGVYAATGTCPGSLTFTDITSATLGACKSFLGTGVALTEFTANLTAGTEYYFMIDGVAGAIGEYCFAIKTGPKLPEPPVNDKPCDAITLVLDGASDCQNTTNATSAGDPTVFGCSTPNNTLWYKYTPTTSGNVLFTLTNPATGKALSGWLGVYTVSGTCPGTLTFTDETTTVLGGCKSFGGTAGSTTSFFATLTAGTEYYFMVDGVSGDTGSYCIAMKTAPSPPASCATNTLPANAAIDVSTTAVTLKWNTVATATDYDLYFGTANPPTTLFGNYTADSALVTGLTYTTTYYWYVVPKNTGGSATGCDANVTSFTTINPPPPPPNDEPCDAITLVLDGPTDCRNTAFATTSANDPTSFSCSTPNNTVWYKYTPTTSGNVLFSFTPPATGTALSGWLGVYAATGTCPGSLTFTDITSATLGACKSFLGTGVAITEFTANLTAGTEYYFMIDGVAGAIGEYCFAIKTPPNPPTTCATNIAPANAAIGVSTTAATLKWNTVALATSYDVYLGTANPPTTKIGSSTTDSTIATGLAYTTIYYWYVVPKNFSGSATGCDATNVTSFTTMNPPPPPANDDICNAIPLVLNGLSDCQNTSFATSTADPLFNCSTPNNTVWYSYTPTSTGVHNFEFTIPAASSALNGWLGVYTSSGGCSGTLTDVTTTVLNSCQSFGTAATTTVAATLTSGKEYFFMVDGVAGAIGSYCIALKKTLPPIASISGRVITPTKKEIPKVVIKLSTASSKDSVLTPINGIYNFSSLASNDYIIKPVKNNDIKKNNGVSTIDVILTTSHILNKVKLNSPYKLIAADVNNNKTITNIDLIFMKRLILGIDTTFTGNRLWTFVDSAYQFADTTNPFPYKDSISITNLTSNKVNQSFIGIKLGDVNYDWNPAVARGGNKKDIELIVKGKEVTEVGEQRISFATKNFNELVAMQYTLNFNNKEYEFVRIENNKLGIEFNTQQSEQGKLGFLWADSKAEEKSLADGSEIFTLVLRPKNTQCKMCDTRLALTNDITEIEGWDKDFNQHNIVLKTNVQEQILNIDRDNFSVSPNPTSGEIVISLTSNSAKKVVFELSNTIGKTLYTQRFETVKGKNAYPINLHKYGKLAKGLYFIKFVGLNNNPVVKIIIE